MENKIRINIAGHEHIKELARVYVRSFRTRGEKWTLKRAEALIKDYISKQSDMVLAARIDNKIVGGFLCLIKPWFDGNRLVETDLFVDPKLIRRGVGAILLKEVLTRAKKNYKAVIVEGITFTNLDFPMSWYKRLGINQTKELMFVNGKIDTILKNLRKET
jgi:GNAT superfamily N-acetyltransferase